MGSETNDALEALHALDETANDLDANEDKGPGGMWGLDDDLESIGNIKAEYMKRIAPDDFSNGPSAQEDRVTKKDVEELIDAIAKPMTQRPFQPGASPEEYDTRFLCWNPTGIIRAQYGDDQSIDVTFHDTESHTSMNLKNDPNYTFGSLSESVIVVGTNGKYGNGPSLIFGINLCEIERDRREWQVTLAHGEFIEGLAAGKKFVAVATDKRYLRLITHSGLQSFVLSMPGQLVCLNAHERRLMMVYHTGSGMVDDQSLAMTTYDEIDLYESRIKCTMDGTKLALSRRSPLAWAGFSDEGAPCTYDYHGIVRVYKHDIGRSWQPVLDCRAMTSSSLDHFFVVGVSELLGGVRAVFCKKSRWPEQNQDVAEFHSFKIPLSADVDDDDKCQLAEEHLRLRLIESAQQRLLRVTRHTGTSSDSAFLTADAQETNTASLAATILKLFVICVNEEKYDAARDLINLMPASGASKMVEYAWLTNRKTYFVDSLKQALEERLERERQSQQVFEELEQDSGVVRTFSLTPQNDENNSQGLRPKSLENLRMKRNGTSNGVNVISDDDDDDLIDQDKDNEDDDDDDINRKTKSSDTDNIKSTKRRQPVLAPLSSTDSNPFKKRK